MGRRLSADERAVLEGRREQLLELRLIEAQLRSDEALRLQDGEHERAAGERCGCVGVGGSGCGVAWLGISAARSTPIPRSSPSDRSSCSNSVR
jgi:hypothetical protein